MSHLAPVKPGAHEHMYASSKSTQMAPFLQGLLTQSSISTTIRSGHQATSTCSTTIGSGHQGPLSSSFDSLAASAFHWPLVKVYI